MERRGCLRFDHPRKLSVELNQEKIFCGKLRCRIRDVPPRRVGKFRSFDQSDQRGGFGPQFLHGWRENWQTKIGPERKGRHLNGSGSNPSVVTDGKNLYALFKSGNLACLNFDGKIIWKKICPAMERIPCTGISELLRFSPANT